MATRPTYGDSDWTDLFDSNYMDHVCDLLRENHPGPADAMRTVLLPQVQAYIDGHLNDAGRTNFEAAEQFHDVVDDVAACLEGGDPGAEHAARLRLSWLEFIAHGAGHHVYHRVPKIRESAAKGGRGSRKLPEPSAILDEVQSYMDKFKNEKDARAEFRRRHGGKASRSAINTAFRKALDALSSR